MTTKHKKGIYERFLKRPIDFLCALMALLVLSPVLLVTAILVRIKLGSPVIFKQQRPGLDEQIFTLYKFRSMTDAKDEEGNLLPDEIRLTGFGKALRATSLDELPELLNILKGDMAVVGPRPQLVRDMVFMTPEQRKRHSVRPGLTGLAQVTGRNAITWDRKLSTDLQYIAHITMLDDLRIILLTVKKVFCREDINTADMATSVDLGDYLVETGRVSQEEYMDKQAEAKKLMGAIQ